MAKYEVILRDGSVEVVDGADNYQQERQMTTFFRTDSGRQIVDCWSTRLASFRTSDIVVIRRTLSRPDHSTGAARANSPLSCPQR